LETVDTLIIGAGVVGLAIAARVSQNNTDVLIVDKNNTFGEEISSRSSEVIHAGIYYPADSLKTSLCVEGKSKLYKYCQDRKISFSRLGKLLVASSLDQESTLEDTLVKARANGVDDLVHLTQSQVHSMEPHVKSISALYSPSTGIINSHELMLSLLAEAESNQTTFATNTEVIKVEPSSSSFVVWTLVQGELYKLQCKNIINSAGLYAEKFARCIEGMPSQLIPNTKYCKGHYFSYSGACPFSKLIYPIPEKNGLGIHATLDLAGQLKFGPDAEFIDDIDYSINPSLVNEFGDAIKRYFPALDIAKLQPSYAGIRPKLGENKFNDFVIQGEQEHNIPGLVNLFGLESPGLTASLAIADLVNNKLKG
jgi:L-2-hydroxyglutarate oxidase LhgO